MKYYITTPELAEGISRIKAIQMGCEGITNFWWSVTHKANNVSYLSFTDEESQPNEDGSPKVLYKNPPDNPVLIITTDDLTDFAYLVASGIEEAVENNL